MSLTKRHPTAATLLAALAVTAVAAVAAEETTGPVTRASAATPPTARWTTIDAASALPPPYAPRPSLDGAPALPPYATWSAEVKAVTDRASAYLATRVPDRSIRAAVVLDIDNTALETAYHDGNPTPATPTVLALAKQAQAAGAAVIFVTARPEMLRALTEDNLQQVGYPNGGLWMREPLDFSSNAELKTTARTKIEKTGYTIVASIGNNDSDLVGGHAERTFKLPDHGGQLS